MTITPPTSPLHKLAPLIISAPFGNYIKPRGSTPTLGTFTLAKRPGRLWRVIKTVRYHRKLKAWTNRIGLRNPGIAWLEERVRSEKISVSEAIISIHGFTDAEWAELVERAVGLKPLAVELNLSCPNVGEVSWPEDLFALAASSGGEKGVGVIAKVPPVRFEGMVDAALGGGVRGFHCCNTIPVPAGGMSGKPLLPMSLACISQVREKASKTLQNGSKVDVFVIGGGGITTSADIDAYAEVGVDRVAIGTKAMHPARLWSDGPLRGLIDHAAGVFGGDWGNAKTR